MGFLLSCKKRPLGEKTGETRRKTKKTIKFERTNKADNEPNQLDNSSKLDLTINLLNMVHEPNELNLHCKLSLLNK